MVAVYRLTHHLRGLAPRCLRIATRFGFGGCGCDSTPARIPQFHPPPGHLYLSPLLPVEPRITLYRRYVWDVTTTPTPAPRVVYDALFRCLAFPPPPPATFTPPPPPPGTVDRFGLRWWTVVLALPAQATHTPPRFPPAPQRTTPLVGEHGHPPHQP